jgi:hypothetical protein
LLLKFTRELDLTLVLDKSVELVLGHKLGKTFGVLKLRIVGVLQDVGAVALEFLWSFRGGDGFLRVRDLVLVFRAQLLWTHASVRHLWVSEGSLETFLEQMLGPVGQLLVVTVGEAAGAAREGPEVPLVSLVGLLSFNSQDLIVGFGM